MRRSYYIFFLLIVTACGSSTEEAEPLKQEEITELDSSEQETEQLVMPVPDEHPVFDTYQKVNAYPTCLAAADSENVFIGSSKRGLFHLNGIEEINHEPRNSDMGYLVRSVFVDSKENVWISSSVKQDRIIKKEGLKWTTFEMEEYQLDGAPTVIFEAANEVYFGGAGGLISGSNWDKVDLPHENLTIIDGHGNSKGDIALIAYSDEGQIVLIRRGNEWKVLEENSPELALGSPKNVLIDEESRVYVSCWKGLLEENGDHYELYQGDDMDIQDFSHAIEDMDIDHAGRLWMCGEVGVIRFDEKGFERMPLTDENDDPYRLWFIDVLDDQIWLVGNSTLLKSE